MWCSGGLAGVWVAVGVLYVCVFLCLFTNLPVILCELQYISVSIFQQTHT